MRTDRLAVAVAVALVVAVAVAGCTDDPDAVRDRQEEVAERGADVMPFDLDATTHRFEPTDRGLVQTVVADRPDDAEQVELVQEHLAEEAERFRRGDYGDPAAIHGDDMPGLATLEARAASVDVESVRLPDGARLTFSSDDPEVVQALHDWGEAQTSDHGDHAEMG
ncbi:MAG TPA: hypothetical protein VK611_01995 [Acidimicrobiales bacterium]|nr:hypothetical protein [Acidimicrobiales bacterium]